MALSTHMEQTWEMNFTDYDGTEHSIRYAPVTDDVSEKDTLYAMEHIVKTMGILIGLDSFGYHDRVMILPVDYKEYNAVKEFLDNYRGDRQQ